MHDESESVAEGQDYGNGEWDSLEEEVLKASKGSLEPYRRVRLKESPTND